MIITIDGPTASGKSVIARELAKRLSYYYLPTGWLYRAVAYLLVNKCGHSPETLSTVTRDQVRDCIDLSRLTYHYDQSTGGQLLYDGNDITHHLKDYTIDHTVAIISPIAVVRELVTEAQRDFAKTHDSVVEGRDTGSVVFPEADHKFYITADLNVRAKRWQKDQLKRGNGFTLEQAIEKVEDRDIKDKSRIISPLVIPEGAPVIDNSNMNIEETVKELLKNIKG